MCQKSFIEIAPRWPIEELACERFYATLNTVENDEARQLLTLWGKGNHTGNSDTQFSAPTCMGNCLEVTHRSGGRQRSNNIPHTKAMEGDGDRQIHRIGHTGNSNEQNCAVGIALLK